MPEVIAENPGRDKWEPKRKFKDKPVAKSLYTPEEDTPPPQTDGKTKKSRGKKSNKNKGKRSNRKKFAEATAKDEASSAPGSRPLKRKKPKTVD